MVPRQRLSSSRKAVFAWMLLRIVWLWLSPYYHDFLLVIVGLYKSIVLVNFNLFPTTHILSEHIKLASSCAAFFFKWLLNTVHFLRILAKSLTIGKASRGRGATVWHASLSSGAAELPGPTCLSRQEPGNPFARFNCNLHLKASHFSPLHHNPHRTDINTKWRKCISDGPR